MLRCFTLPFFALLSLIATPLAASEPDSAGSAGKADLNDAAGQTSSGLQVFIDEQTGEVRAPTEAEMAEMAEQFRRRYIDLSVDKPPVYHADGSISKELGTAYRMYSVARLGTDGEMETECLPAEQAADFLGRRENAEAEAAGEPERDAAQ